MTGWNRAPRWGWCRTGCNNKLGDYLKEARRCGRIAVSGVVEDRPGYDIRPNIPFVGSKKSGLGNEFAEEGLHEFTQIRIVNEAR